MPNVIERHGHVEDTIAVLPLEAHEWVPKGRPWYQANGRIFICCVNLSNAETLVERWNKHVDEPDEEPATEARIESWRDRPPML